MPTSLSNPSNTSLKSYSLIILFLIAPLFFYAQHSANGQSLTGLWIGSLSNDSTTVRKDHSFEIALTEYNGKVAGYSRSEFIVDDTLYYIVKRVKGMIKGDLCQVEDDEIVSFNFRGKLDKGVKVTSTFRRNHSDSSWYLAGTWKTNATKKYYAVTGKINLEEEKDLAASKIFPHLEELNLANDIAFYKERTEAPVIVKLVKPEKIKTEYSTKPVSIASNNIASPNPSQPEISRAEANTVSVSANSSVIAKIDAPTNREQKVEDEIIGSERKATEEITEGIKKNQTDLPKTDLKSIPGSTITINPNHTDKKIAEVPVLEDIAQGIKKQETDLPKTDLKMIQGSTVTVNPNHTDKKIAEVPVLEEITKGIRKQETELPKPDHKVITGSKVKLSPTEINKKIAENKPPPQTQVVVNKPVINNNPQETSNITSAKPVINKQQEQKIVVDNKVPEKSSNSTATNLHNQPSVVPVKTIESPKIDLIKQAAIVSGRKSEFSQMVSFKSDSLEVSLYDNGEIDGDTVSVYMNGQVILAKQGLKASAIKKTIYLSPDQKEFTLVLFAENLGKYPPNTGLLVVHDGDDVYNLRFSSDLQKNAGIIFKRK